MELKDLQGDPNALTPEAIAAKEVADKATLEAANQDPLKIELEKVKQKGDGKTELEKAIFTRNKLDERIRELAGDTDKTVATDDDDNAPVTMGMLKKLQQETAVKTSLQLAEEIQDPTERELTKHHIKNSIKSTGNPTEDLSLARAIVNAAKNRQVIEELSRKGDPKSHSNAGGAPGKFDTTPQELSAEELLFTKPPFNMTKEAILKARKS